MSFPPELPQDYCDYFQGHVLYSRPPEPKWEAGLRASQLWRDYWEQREKFENRQLLISIVVILMPFRGSGSGLLDLWQRILMHVATLPVDEQKAIWREVFNTANQGGQPIRNNEVAIQILKEWIELDRNAESIRISPKIMMSLADKIYMHTFSGHDWIAFTVAISEWFKKYIDEPSFYDLVCDKFGKQPNRSKTD